MATVHGDDITIGGERSAVIKMISRKFEIKKQVIEWDRDGITIEADQKHDTEIFRDVELERANHSATPCAVERKDESSARSDESKGEN